MMSMRTSTLWIVLCCWSILLTGQSATPVSYRIDVEEQEDLLAVLQRLESDYQWRFAYVADDMARVYPGERSIEAASPEGLCRKLFLGTSVQWQVQKEEDRILLRYAPDAPMWISGYLIDSLSGQPIAGASMGLRDFPIGTYTDDEGRYSLELSAQYEQEVLVVQSLGYDVYELQAGELARKEFLKLRPRAISIPAITITEVPLPPMVVPSFEGDTIQADGANLLGANAGLGASIQRLAQLEAGVEATNDLSNELRIRGSDGAATLIILDDIPIYRADHFYGLFSNINPFYITESTLYKNALPVEYGGRTGGMLLMNSPRFLQKPRGSGIISLYDGGLATGFQVGSRAEVQLAGRTSIGNAANTKFFDWFQAEFDPTLIDAENFRRPPLVEPDPAFQYFDLNGKLTLTLPNRTWLTASLFASQDALNSQYEITYPSVFERLREDNRETFIQNDEWLSLGTSLRLTKQWSNRWQSDWTAFYSTYRDSSLVLSQIEQVRRRSVKVTSTQTSYQNDLRGAGLKFTTQLNHPKKRAPQLLFGLQVDNYRIDTRLRADSMNILGRLIQTTEASTFGTYNWQPNESLLFQVGGRLTYYGATKQVYGSPRLALEYRIGRSLRLKSAYSEQYQFLRSVNYETIYGAEVDLLALASSDFFEPASTESVMVGVDWQPGRWLVDVEAYYKYQDNVIEFAQLRPGLGQSDIRPNAGTFTTFTGTGRIKGIDLTVGYRSDRFDTRLAYTLSRAEQRFPTIFNNQYFLQPYDRPHQLKQINRYRFGRFEASATFIYASGQTFTDITLLDYLLDRRDIDIRQRTSRLPAYMRLDLGLQYHLEVGSTGVQIGLSVFNATDRDNVRQIQYFYSYFTDTATGTRNTVIGAQTPLLGRTVNLSALVQF